MWTKAVSNLEINGAKLKMCLQIETLFNCINCDN